MSLRIAQFSPRDVTGEDHARVREFVQACARDYHRPTTPVSTVEGTLSILTRHTTWCVQVGIPLERDSVLHPQVIAVFTDDGISRLAPASRRTYRARLNKVSLALRDATPMKQQPINGTSIKPPFTQAEERLLRVCADGQATDARRVNFWALICLGLGAGLQPREIAAARAEDIVEDQYGVLVHVRGDRAREVPLLAEWESPLLSIARAQMRQDQYLFKPRRRVDYASNLFAQFLATCNSLPFPVQAGRLRATWLTTHLAAGTPIPVLLEAAGLESLDGLARYVRFLPSPTYEETRAVMRALMRAEGK